MPCCCVVPLHVVRPLFRRVQGDDIPDVMLDPARVQPVRDPLHFVAILLLDVRPQHCPARPCGKRPSPSCCHASVPAAITFEPVLDLGRQQHAMLITDLRRRSFQMHIRPAILLQPCGKHFSCADPRAASRPPSHIMQSSEQQTARNQSSTHPMIVSGCPHLRKVKPRLTASSKREVAHRNSSPVCSTGFCSSMPRFADPNVLVGFDHRRRRRRVPPDRRSRPRADRRLLHADRG